jgi:hypothetical protein
MEDNQGHTASRQEREKLPVLGWIRQGFVLLLILPVRIYQWVISPFQSRKFNNKTIVI